MNSCTFPFDSSQVQFYPQLPDTEDLRSAIAKAFPVSYEMNCQSSSNNYQLDSTFDQCLDERFEQMGHERCQLSLPGELQKQYDFAFTIAERQVAFEVEKANHEKILYDLLKAHIYVKAGASFVVLLCPTERGRKQGVNNVLHIAKTRYDQCVQFGMGSRNLFDRILLVGFNQRYQERPFDQRVRDEIRTICKTTLVSGRG